MGFIDTATLVGSVLAVLGVGIYVIAAPRETYPGVWTFFAVVTCGTSIVVIIAATILRLMHARIGGTA